MIVAPCSMKTLAEIASGLSSGLISRAADVVLKERRRLAARTRDAIHAHAFAQHGHRHGDGRDRRAARAGVLCAPASLDQMIDHTLGRVLDLFDLDSRTVHRWKENASQPNPQPNRLNGDAS